MQVVIGYFYSYFTLTDSVPLKENSLYITLLLLLWFLQLVLFKN